MTRLTLTQFQLKLLMAFLMLLDHIHQFIPGTPLYFTWLGRLVAPAFMFLVAEGFYHTRDRRKYFWRLFTAGVFMALLNRLIPALVGGPPVPNNIFLNLAAAVAFWSLYEAAEERGKLLQATPFLVVIFLLSLFTEGAFLGVILVGVFHRLRGEGQKITLLYTLLSLSFFPFAEVIAGNLLYAFTGSFQWMMVFTLFFIHRYNGHRGRGWKGFFYLFYPLHIHLLYLIGQTL